jgi:hypothetical protein
MTAYPTHVLACDVCGHVFVEPLLPLVRNTREEAQQRGWRSAHVTDYLPASYRYAFGARTRRQSYLFDFCDRCAVEIEGIFPLVKPPKRFDILDYLRSKEDATTARALRQKDETGSEKGYEKGFNEGRQKGYNEGYQKGYNEGHQKKINDDGEEDECWYFYCWVY